MKLGQQFPLLPQMGFPEAPRIRGWFASLIPALPGILLIYSCCCHCRLAQYAALCFLLGLVLPIPYLSAKRIRWNSQEFPTACLHWEHYSRWSMQKQAEGTACYKNAVDSSGYDVYGFLWKQLVLAMWLRVGPLESLCKQDILPTHQRFFCVFFKGINIGIIQFQSNRIYSTSC